MRYSVVIPCMDIGNKRCSIPLTVAGLFNQNYSSYEVILVVDCTGVQLPTTVQEVIGDKSNFCVVETDGKKQRSEARNIGATQAKGERLVFMDDDALILSDSVFSALDCVDIEGGFAAGARRKWLHLCWCHETVARCIASNDTQYLESISIVPSGIKRKTGRRDLQEFSFFGHFGCIGHDDFDRIGGFNESYVGWGYEDIDIMLRAYILNRKYYHLFNDIDVFHLTHPINRTEMESRSQNVSEYENLERSLGVHFHVNRLFGVYDDVPNGPILDKRRHA